jgi:uncharacterized caspase-like protein
MARQALVVGVNRHKNPNFNLAGCVNDADSLVATLTNFYGFDSANIVTLKDDQATKHAIMSQIVELFTNINEGDVIVFAFAGHGTKHHVLQDDMVVEAIVPYDTTSRAELISNKDINSIARQMIQDKHLRERVNFTAIYDCCHSGEMYRSIELNANGEFQISIINRILDLSKLIPPNSARDIELNDDFQVFSACDHEQTAADLSPRPGMTVPRGAFSFILHQAMGSNPQVSVSDLEAGVPGPIAALVAPRIQVPVFAVQEKWKDKPILTV